MAKLIIHGWFKVDQFYPKGNSDADTLKVKAATIHFENNGTARDVYSTVLDACTFDARRNGYKRVMTSGELRIRVEFVDACELHYPSPADDHIDYRQPLGATATQLFSALLEPLAIDGWVPCEVVTEVEKLEDSFDVYGRLIGQVLVGKEKRSLNRLLLEEGLAFPSFYDSASVEEIKDMRAAAVQARAQNKLVWEYYSRILRFDPNLIFSKQPGPQSDFGQAVLPKIYRRLAEYRARASTETFRAFLEAKNEQVMLTEDFLARGKDARRFPLAACVVQAGDDNLFLPDPDQIIFTEKASALFQLNKETNQYEPWGQKPPHRTTP